MEEYLKRDEAAEFIGFARSTMDVWRVIGYGPAFLKVGPGRRLVRYRLSDLLRWMETESVRMTPRKKIKRVPLTVEIADD